MNPSSAAIWTPGGFRGFSGGKFCPPPIPSISEEISKGKAAAEATTQPRPGKENGWRMRPATLALAAGRKARRLVVRQPLFVSPQR